MKLYSLRIKCAFIALCACISITSYAAESQTKALLERSSFAEDAALSHLLVKYFFNAPWRTVSKNNGVYGDSVRRPHSREFAMQNADIWIDHVLPSCDYLKSTYEAGHAGDRQTMKGSELSERTEINRSINEFMNKFNVAVFDKCDTYQRDVGYFNTKDDAAKKIMETVLYDYEDALNEARDASDIGLAKSLSVQTSKRYVKRKTMQFELELTLAWLNKLGSDKSAIAKWNKRYNELRDGWNQLINDNKDRVALKSALPKDVFQFGSEPIREIVLNTLKKQYQLEPKDVLLTEEAVRINNQKLIIKDGKMVGINYSVIPFAAVVQQGSDAVSSHVGWLELHFDEDLHYRVADGKPFAYFRSSEDNFKQPRVEQIVVTNKDSIPAVAPREKRKPAKASTSVESAAPAESVNSTAKDVVDDGANDLSAENDPEDSGTTSTPVSNNSGEVDYDVPSSSGGGLFSTLFGIASALVLLFGGVLSASSFIASKIPEKNQEVFNNFLNNLNSSRGIIAIILLVLGVLGLLMGVMSLSLLSIVSALVSVCVGLVLSDEGPLKSVDIVQNLASKVQGFAMPAGIAAIVLGFLSIVASL